MKVCGTAVSLTPLIKLSIMLGTPEMGAVRLNGAQYIYLSLIFRGENTPKRLSYPGSSAEP